MLIDILIILLIPIITLSIGSRVPIAENNNIKNNINISGNNEFQKILNMSWEYGGVD